MISIPIHFDDLVVFGVLATELSGLCYTYTYDSQLPLPSWRQTILSRGRVGSRSSWTLSPAPRPCSGVPSPWDWRRSAVPGTFGSPGRRPWVTASASWWSTVAPPAARPAWAGSASGCPPGARRRCGWCRQRSL